MIDFPYIAYYTMYKYLRSLWFSVKVRDTIQEEEGVNLLENSFYKCAENKI